MTSPDKEQIYLEYRDKVRGYIHGKIFHWEDAEDLVSTVFVKVLSQWEQYDAARGSVSTWIYQITRNTVIDFWRAQASQEKLQQEAQLEFALPPSSDPDELLQLLADALATLPPKQRDLVVLHDYQGVPLKEAAQRLQMSYSNAKLLRGKALSALALRLKE